MLPAVFLACSIFVLPAAAQLSTGSSPNQTVPHNTKWHAQSNRLPKAERNYYALVWGVDSLSVRYAESGQIIRFSYQVVDANKAKAMNDDNAEPYLYDYRAKVKLVIPKLEFMGQMRQTATPEKGKSYWMGFSNKGSPVKKGDRVSVEIGKFKIDGLVVE